MQMTTLYMQHKAPVCILSSEEFKSYHDVDNFDKCLQIKVFNKIKYAIEKRDRHIDTDTDEERDRQRRQLVTLVSGYSVQTLLGITLSLSQD